MIANTPKEAFIPTEIGIKWDRSNNHPDQGRPKLLPQGSTSTAPVTPPTTPTRCRQSQAKGPTISRLPRPHTHPLSHSSAHTQTQLTSYTHSCTPTGATCRKTQSGPQLWAKMASGGCMSTKPSSIYQCFWSSEPVKVILLHLQHVCFICQQKIRSSS